MTTSNLVFKSGDFSAIALCVFLDDWLEKKKKKKKKTALIGLLLILQEN